MESEAGLLRCPSCGAPCSPDARACPHCDVELASVRCTLCFALHFAGSRFCARCGKELAPEPLLDVVDAPCPRCSRPLSAAPQGSPDAPPDEMLCECIGCGGIFADRATLARILARAVRTPLPGDPDGRPSVKPVSGASAHVSDAVRYLKCPVCSAVMNRTQFRHGSGVVVSVCKEHGTWFDAGELTIVVEFVASGGLGP